MHRRADCALFPVAVVDTLREFLRTDDEDEERGGRGAMAAGSEGETAKHWLDPVRLDHLRRYATQPPSLKSEIRGHESCST